MTAAPWPALAARVTDALRPSAPPIAITFTAQRPDGVPAFADPMPPRLPDGRTGRVPAGCVFWMRAVDGTFSTVPEDHGNCSVGSLTHGLKRLDEVADNDDVATLLGSGWVTEEMVPRIPTVSDRPGAVTYGPLADTRVEPDVVLLRMTARSLMVMSDALDDLSVEGKPQCHIVAMAKEHGRVAASVGCALSRVRTGMAAEELTCAIPADRLEEVVDRVERTAAIDGAVARYAGQDSRRF